MNQKNLLFLVLIFLLLLQVSQGSSISAEQGFPIRIGRVKLDTIIKNISRQIIVLYNVPSFEPLKGVFLSLLSYSHQEQKLCVDYDFQPKSINSVGFILKSSIEKIYQLKYTLLVINYLMTGLSSQIKAFSHTLVDSIKRTNSTHTVFLFTFQINNPVKEQVYASLVGLRAMFFQEQFMQYFAPYYVHVNKTSYYDSTQQKMVETLHHWLNIQAIFFIFSNITQVKIAYMYQEPLTNTNFTSGLTFLSFSKRSRTNKFQQKRYAPSHFYFLLSFYAKKATKLDFDISLKQSNVIFTSNNFNVTTYVFIQLYAGRTICTHISYQFMHLQDYKCYDKCPFGKYPDTFRRCLPCSSCTSINTCLLCYSNYCEKGFYLSNVAILFECKQCSSQLRNCKQCTSNQTGVFCIECDTARFPYKIQNGICVICYFNEYLKNGTTCEKCNVVLTNCITCSSNADMCFYCSIASYLVNGLCRSCNETSYLQANSICTLCSNLVQNCYSCSINGQVCYKCIESSSVYHLNNGSCLPCNETSYLKNNILSICQLCFIKIPNCSICSITGDKCTSCVKGSNTQLENDQCLLCNSSSFFDNLTLICQLCSTKIINCSSCSLIGEQCFSCIVESKSELINNKCSKCNYSSFFDINTIKCKLCSSIIPSCITCFNNTDFICNSCIRQNILLNNQCILKCQSLKFPYCQICQNQSCIKCIETSKTQLITGSCEPCGLLDFFDQKDRKCKSCLFLNNNAISTYECSFKQSTQLIINSTMMVVSFPTLNILVSGFIQLCATIDDLSYYTYHNIQYYSSLQILFQFSSSVALARFIPQFIQDYFVIFQEYKPVEYKISFKQPETYLIKGEDAYFLNNTINIWVGNIPLCLIVFFTFAFLHWIINKFIKNNFFKQYKYFGMIIVSLLSGNLQYFSFRCFSNLFQSIPIGIISYFNLVLCYSILLVIIIYSIASIRIFLIFYPKVKYSFLCQNLFDTTANWEFISYNLLKVLSGFVHAYLFYEPLKQSILLTTIYFIKLFLVLKVLRVEVEKRYRSSAELISQIIMFVFQTIIAVEQIYKSVDPNDYLFLSKIGWVQVILIIILILNKIQLVIFQLFRSFIISLFKFFNVKLYKNKINNKNAKIMFHQSLPKRKKKQNKQTSFKNNQHFSFSHLPQKCCFNSNKIKIFKKQQIFPLSSYVNNPKTIIIQL